MARIKVKANAMEDADVRFVSLVSRPASRLPFRAFKSEDGPAKEGTLMINLTRMFKRDGDATQEGCALAGVVVQKQHVAHFEPQLKEIGLRTDDLVEQDGIVIFRQCEYAEDAVVAIKLNEMGGLFTNTPEKVAKAFDPFGESKDFDENMSQSGFLPGMSVATEVLMDTVRNVLRTAEDGPSARAGLESALSAYSNHVLDFVDDLPSVAFKIDTMTLEGFESTEEVTDDADQVGDGSTGDAESVSKDEGRRDDGDGTGEPNADAAATDGSEESEGEAEKETVSKTEEEGGKSDLDKEVRDKGIHIEDLDVDPNAGDTSEASDGEADKATPTEKSEESDPNPMEAIATKMGEVLEAISGVRQEVAELKTKQGELADEVKDVAEKADKATKAVKGTVPASSDAQINEGLGTHKRNRKSDTDQDERTWGGTGLDRIVGDFGSGS